ncbi:MAG: hypothetical protein ACJ763_16810 [Bdellovibrionia bacterium]
MKLLSFYRISIGLISVLTLAHAPFPAPFSNQTLFTAYAQGSPQNQETLALEIGQRITRVPEFQFIREEAKRMGVRAYLFGGTAAGFAHYVNWDLKREGGDARFQPNRFHYDYTDIFRSTQDLDIVLDGPPEKAQELQDKLAKNFPHLQGNKTAWEVRLLRQDMGDKQALLNNPEFLNQHTDSNSTGMIEITEPQGGEPVVRDLRDWNSKDPYFLRDVREGKLHYYFSPKHAQTKFAKEGRNPPIISVIRYLTKAFQYELEIRPEDLAQIQKIIDEFDPKGREMKNDYVRNWLLKKDNGRKLIQNAVNIEYAWDTLEKLGLRKKLIAVENNADSANSLAWWMSKEPLRSHPLGKGPRVSRASGAQTIRELIAQGALPADLTVAHETNNFLAYESITRAHTGDPNVLISRNGKAGEAAAYGDGFYTQIGREGARGTGITIRFHVHPDAKEGVDFTRENSFLIFHNKNALRVIPESLNLTPHQYFEFLANGDKIDPSERAIFEKLKRKVTAGRGALSDEEYGKIRAVVAASIQKGEFNEPLLKEWAALPRSAHWSHDLFDPLLKLKVYDVPLSEMIFTQPQFAEVPKFSEIHANSQKLRQKIQSAWNGSYGSLLSEAIQNHPDDALRLAYPLSGNLDATSLSLITQKLLPKIQSEDFVIKVINDVSRSAANDSDRRKTEIKNIIGLALAQPHATPWKRTRLALIDQIFTPEELDELYQKVLSRPDLSDEETTIAAIKRLKLITGHQSGELSGPHYQNLADQVLRKPFARNWTRAQSEFIQSVSFSEVLLSFVNDFLKPPYSKESGSEDLALQAIKQIRTIAYDYSRGYKNFFETLSSEVANDPNAKNWTRVRMQLIKHAPIELAQSLSEEILHRPDHAEFVSKLVRENSPEIDEGVARLQGFFPVLKKDPAWLKEYLKRSTYDGALFESAIHHPALARDDSSLIRLISNGPAPWTISSESATAITRTAFGSSHFNQNPEVIEAVSKRYPNNVFVARNLIAHPDVTRHPEWVEPLVQFSISSAVDEELANLLKDPAWKDRTDWLQILIKRHKIDQKQVKELLSKPHWKNHPELRQMCGGKKPDFYCLSSGEPNPSIAACVVGAIKWLITSGR